MEEYVDEVDEIIAARDSYITKEKFLAILTNLDFIAIKSAELHFITGYKVKGKDNVITLGYDIEII